MNVQKRFYKRETNGAEFCVIQQKASKSQFLQLKLLTLFLIQLYISANHPKG